MTAIRKTSMPSYSPQERRVLLTGVPCSAASTRFGHPTHGWNTSEIREAWLRLGDELTELWSAPEYAVYRARDPRPFAERILEEQQ